MGNTGSISSKERRLFLDALRILAAFLVCYNHSYAFHLYLDQEPDGSVFSWICVATSVLTTIHLPLFFMISGALLLGKKESYRDIFSKRIGRFLILLVCFSGMVYLTVGERPLRAEVFLRDLLGGNIYLTYWYLYAYLSLLLAKPILQKIADQLTGQDFIFLILFRVVFFSGTMLLNACASFSGTPSVVLSENIQLPFSCIDILFYPLAGYYLVVKLPMEKIGRRELWGCVAVLLFGTGVTSAVVYAEGYYLGFTQNYITMFSYSSAIAVLLLVRYVMNQFTIPDRMEKMIVAVSGVTIGIYVLEPFADHYLYEPFHRGMSWTPFAVVARSLLWCITSMIFRGGITYLLRKIPGVKRIL